MATILRRWNSKPFMLARIEEVGSVVGVYMLMTEAGYVNYVGATRNLRATLHRHYREGDIPAVTFTAYQTGSYDDAVRLARQRIGEYEPYYNELA